MSNRNGIDTRRDSSDFDTNSTRTGSHDDLRKNDSSTVGIAGNERVISTLLESVQLNTADKRVSESKKAAHPKRVTVECQVRARIPYPGGQFYLHLYKNDFDNKEHLAIVFGNTIKSKSLERVREGETEMDRKVRGASVDDGSSHLNNENQKALIPLVRIHSECYTGETVSSTRCDCGYQLAESMRLMSNLNNGVVVYLRQEGRNIGLGEKLKAYNLQDMGHDTVNANLLLNHPADGRTYEVARAILFDLDCLEMNLLTNNPDKIKQLTEGDCDDTKERLTVVERIPMIPSWWLDGDTAHHMETFQGLSKPTSSRKNSFDEPRDSFQQIEQKEATSLDDATDRLRRKSFVASYTQLSSMGDSAPSNPATINPVPFMSGFSDPLQFSSHQRHVRPFGPSMAEADKYLYTKALKMGHML
ncbi:putative GTP cyclohydrolase-2, partial [Zancudomyces culisetae]